jgi:hypothetical protein
MKCNWFNAEIYKYTFHVSASIGPHQKVLQHYRKLRYMYAVHMFVYRDF